MAKTINTILNLKDKMSEGLSNASRNAGKLSKEIAASEKRVRQFGSGAESASKKTDKASKNIERAQKKFKNFGINAAKSIDRVTNKTVKMAGGIAAAIAGLALKTGLTEAIDLEGYRTQLETATKDTKKASSIMQYAIKLANKTPFEGGDVVEAAAKFEAMGLSAKKYLTITGDMAGATNKSLDQATEAIIDAQTGELERLKEFGITKNMIAKKANKMFKNQEIINAKGQIVDQKKFNEAMTSLMQDKFTGGMEKQAGTLKGVWSTVTGTVKSSLASMVGMSTDGTIKQGSILDTLKEKVTMLAEKIQKWQSDGTITKITKKVTSGFEKMLSTVGRVTKFIRKNKDIIIKVGKLVAVIVGVAAATAKVVMIGMKVMKIIKKVKDAMNILKILGLGPVAIIIAAIIALGIALYLNWDKVKAFAIKLGNKCKEVFENIKEKFSVLVKSVKKKVDGIKKKAIEFKNSVKKFFQSIGDAIKGGIAGAFKWVTDKIDKVKSAVKWVKDKLPGGKSSNDSTGANANGNQYWKGGRTAINEHGPEIVDLPSGTRIYPAGTSKKMNNKSTNVNVTVNIQGNVIGNKRFAKEIGEEVSKELLLAIDG